MTRQERVKRYMEILDKYDEGNSSWNWRILDKLSDEELFDEEKIAEKINIIKKHEERINNNPNKYPEEIMEYVRQRQGLENFDDSRDEEINQLSPDEVFDHVCNWKGLLGCATTIKSQIRDIYKMELGEVQKVKKIRFHGRGDKMRLIEKKRDWNADRNFKGQKKKYEVTITFSAGEKPYWYYV